MSDFSGLRSPYRSESSAWLDEMGLDCRRWTPEELLLYNILFRAILDLATPQNCFIFKEASAWILCRRHMSEEPFGFRWICDMLDLKDNVVEQIKRIARREAKVLKVSRFELLRYNNNRITGRRNRKPHLRMTLNIETLQNLQHFIEKT